MEIQMSTNTHTEFNAFHLHKDHVPHLSQQDVADCYQQQALIWSGSRAAGLTVLYTAGIYGGYEAVSYIAAQAALTVAGTFAGVSIPAVAFAFIAYELARPVIDSFRACGCQCNQNHELNPEAPGADQVFRQTRRALEKKACQQH